MDKKIILVTGATSGFGKKIAENLVSEGHTVYGTGRKVAEGPAESGVFLIPMDVTDKESVISAINKIIGRSGRLDVLVNNAGVGIGGALEMTSESELALQMGTNFNGTVNVTVSVLPYMRKMRKGRIIFVSSIAGTVAVPYQGIYSASKFAIEGFAEALAMEVRRFGILVSVIEPGDCNTGFTSSRKISEATLAEPDYAEVFRKVLAGVESSEKSGSDPEVVAQAVCKLINCKRPPFRTVVGPFIQCVFASIRKFLPDRLVHCALRKFYSAD